MPHCGQMRTVNLSQDVDDQGDYFFSLAAVAVNHRDGAPAKISGEAQISAISAIEAAAGR